MGDINALPGDAAIQALLSNSSFVDTYNSYNETGVDKAKCATWHDWQGGLYNGQKLDYIFVTPNMNLDSLVIDRTAIDEQKGIYPSDHYPVIAIIHPV